MIYIEILYINPAVSYISTRKSGGTIGMVMHSFREDVSMVVYSE